jgi:hypothetical protein
MAVSHFTSLQISAPVERTYTNCPTPVQDVTGCTLEACVARLLLLPTPREHVTPPEFSSRTKIPGALHVNCTR